LRGVPKSVRFCFAYLPWRDAVRLPVVVSHTVRFERLKGTVRIDAPPRFAMIRLGFGDAPGVDRRYARSSWDVRPVGEVIFAGPTRMGPGSSVVVGGTLVIGANVGITGKSTIICHRRVVIGDGSALAWDCLLMDTDHHDVNAKPRTAEIVIGEAVWVGCRATILKGVHIGAGSVVGANSCVTRSFAEPTSLIAGNPACLIRTGVSWS
jgi:acetyltransferase-like isoleucine patch superfamily enzyme